MVSGGVVSGTAVFCGYCGKELGGLDHGACALRLRVIDPPRFCSACARRMVVQVTPSGWAATCSRHGEITSAR
ncbi:biotin synthase auxiliary protein BsaP [Saccharothrix espanaensis]